MEARPWYSGSWSENHVGSDDSTGRPRANVSPWPFDRAKYEVRVRSVLPSTKQSLNFGVEQVLRVAEDCCDLSHSRDDLEIALREALANALIHGNQYGDGKRILLRCYAGASTGVLVVVRDEGDGFDPAKVPDPRDPDRMHLHHGRGIFLMRELMDHIEHRKGGREVVLYKACASPE